MAMRTETRSIDAARPWAVPRVPGQRVAAWIRRATRRGPAHPGVASLTGPGAAPVSDPGAAPVRSPGAAPVKSLVAAAIAALALGCAARPVLYPNAHRTEVGAAAAEADVAECLALAKSAGSEAGRGREVVRKTFGGAAFGAITGVVVGAITGNPGRGAAIGGAGGGTAGLLHGIGGPRPDEITRRFTERCLHDRGYDPVGWR